MEKLKNKLTISKKVTDDIIRRILDHLKWTYNQKYKDFDVYTLETFGLECCLNCSSMDN